MPTIDLGKMGAVLSPDHAAFVDTAVELERLGYTTIWVTGGPMTDLDQLAQVVRATTSVRVASGIIPVSRFPAEDVAALYAELEGSHPERFVVGLGGAHDAHPMMTLNAYLDLLEPVPQSRRVMAALGPKMFELARDRAAGALPVLITPEYTARARAVLGDDATLAVEQLVVLERDAELARQIARGPLRFLATIPAYQASFRRMGFAEDDIVNLGDSLIDALVAWGDTATIQARIGQHLEAGADHIAVSVVSESPSPTLDEWRAAAAALVDV